MEKKKGKFLTTSLIFIMIMTIFNLYAVSAIDLKEVYKNTPSWLSTFIIIGTLVDIVALIGIWQWRKVAVYIYTTSSAVWILIESLIIKTTDEGLSSSLIGITVLVLIFWAISRKWKYFI